MWERPSWTTLWACAVSAAAARSTLSVVDLAELEKTVPGKFREFALGLYELL
jgi:hypothetical protein